MAHLLHTDGGIIGQDAASLIVFNHFGDRSSVDLFCEPTSSGYSVDCAKVRVVFLGSFQRLLERKSEQSGAIGFRTPMRQKYGDSNTEDLCDHDMRAVFAGRINRIICMNPLTSDDLVRISQQGMDRIVYTSYMREK